MLGFLILQATAPMEFKRRRRRHTEPKEAVDARSIHGITDNLLWRILLHLNSPLWLLRAACACKRWRRIVDGADGGRAFLRLASSLHPPAVVGHYHSLIGGGHRFVPSSPPAPIYGSRFSLDFIHWGLVTGTSTPIKNWKVADCHGGLVLLRDRHAFLSDLVVCDPLTRRYLGIHRPPDPRPPVAAGHRFSKIFLIDGDNGNTSVSNFRVLYRAVHDSGRVSNLYLFSTAGGGDWRLLRRSSEPDDRYSDGVGGIAGGVDGSLYLGSGNGIVTVLDNAKLEFSKVDLPIHVEQSGPYPLRSAFAVVQSDATSPGPGPDPALPPTPPGVWIVHVHGEKLELFRQVHGRGGEWVLEHTIPKLSRATRVLPGYPPDQKYVRRWLAVKVIAGGLGFAILSVWLFNRAMAWQFSFNVDTMELQAVSNEAAGAYRGTTVTSVFTYTLPWPQFLRACPS